MYNSNQDVMYEKVNNGDDKKYFTVYMSDILKGLSKFWWVCIALAVIIGGCVFADSYLNFKPSYKSTAVFTINTQDSTLAQGGISSYSFYYDSATASQLSDIFPYILDSSYLKDAICDDLGTAYVPATLSASSVEDSNMFTLESVSGNAETAYRVLLSAMKNYPEVAKYVIGDVNFSIITQPEIADAPFNRSAYKKNTVIGVFVGFAMGLMFILLYAFARKTIRTDDDIKTELKVKNLGAIPKIELKKHNKNVNKNILITNENIGEGFYDALRVARNTLLNNLDKNEKVVMITSTAPEEGKTTVLSNLALSIANMNKKVLVIDADLRNPSINDTLKTDNDETKSDKDYSIRKFSDYVSVLRFNTENFFDIIDLSELRKFFSQIKEGYDYVLVDTPPCGLVSDSLIIAQAVDTVVYVVMQDTVRISKIQSSINDLISSDVKITGCILNAAESGLSGYGRYYGYGYYKHGRYGYGRYGYGKHNYGYSHNIYENKDE